MRHKWPYHQVGVHRHGGYRQRLSAALIAVAQTKCLRHANHVQHGVTATRRFRRRVGLFFLFTNLPIFGFKSFRTFELDRLHKHHEPSLLCHAMMPPVAPVAPSSPSSSSSPSKLARPSLRPSSGSASNIMRSLSSVHLPPPPLASISANILHLHHQQHTHLSPLKRSLSSYSSKSTTSAASVTAAQHIFAAPNLSSVVVANADVADPESTALPSASTHIPPPHLMPVIEDDGEKPPFSYATLIGMAILRAENRRLTLAQIYKWINDTFAWYRASDASWQNSIRHNLSLNKAFSKQERPKDDPGKGNYWVVEPGCEYLFLKGRPRKQNSGNFPRLPNAATNTTTISTTSTTSTTSSTDTCTPSVHPSKRPLEVPDSSPEIAIKRARVDQFATPVRTAASSTTLLSSSSLASSHLPALSFTSSSSPPLSGMPATPAALGVRFESPTQNQQKRVFVDAKHATSTASMDTDVDVDADADIDVDGEHAKFTLRTPDAGGKRATRISLNYSPPDSQFASGTTPPFLPIGPTRFSPFRPLHQLQPPGQISSPFGSPVYLRQQHNQRHLSPQRKLLSQQVTAAHLFDPTSSPSRDDIISRACFGSPDKWSSLSGLQQDRPQLFIDEFLSFRNQQRTATTTTATVRSLTTSTTSTPRAQFSPRNDLAGASTGRSLDDYDDIDDDTLTGVTPRSRKHSHDRGHSSVTDVFGVDVCQVVRRAVLLNKQRREAIVATTATTTAGDQIIDSNDEPDLDAVSRPDVFRNMTF
ncbi:hypothetical protein V1514DRAFT_325642 [Lipomyces japonicus]|uniref:uncharacterized protein n=1 Tax=Lipomyces japonicus TaxID=56871 RepID=UPI0034CFB297